MNMPFLIGLIAIAAIIIWFVAIYNSLITLKNRVDEAWSDIDVQLKRRHDLIPNLVETVKGYMSHEASTLQNVTEARNMAVDAQKNGAEAVGKAENNLMQTLKSLFAVAENYPDLKANQNFMKLQDELSDTENKIQASRRFYNGNVRDFNTQIQVFPNNMVSGMFGFGARQFFEIADAAEKENVVVKF